MDSDIKHITCYSKFSVSSALGQVFLSTSVFFSQCHCNSVEFSFIHLSQTLCNLGSWHHLLNKTLEWGNLAFFLNVYKNMKWNHKIQTSVLKRRQVIEDLKVRVWQLYGWRNSVRILQNHVGNVIPRVSSVKNKIISCEMQLGIRQLLMLLELQSPSQCRVMCAEISLWLWWNRSASDCVYLGTQLHLNIHKH